MIVAAFATERALHDAVADLRRDVTCRVETYGASPPEEGGSFSIVPLLMLGGGMVGAVGGFGMQVYATTLAYPQDIGGRPDLSWPSYIPASFELAVMGAVLAGMIGYFATVRLPRLHDPVDEAGAMQGVMTGGHVAVVRGFDDSDAVRAVFVRHGALTIEDIAP
ncbi:DUF3341 domain-containing protein [Gluconacetobacter entanii]|uniref:DUF3341 domain-containing protein n=1 Tax=Gluconacetobacter entanii TaxID=108528 RepID=A0ABT3KA60_9PROT|nr:DUF3341 domain-containing protein [Gluconacetobacter entanii]MCW4592298.1 DUF3341 domain-containing protein [Gluconacetobacter entanii]MCW4595693.1 DUF3341 domain-containing protein [Gluconacetobacter entanii]NPC87511.1 DUF3341 domain-containing protein [Gluconacetobacter entanii]